MRKQTKLVAVLSAAALLAIGASMTSFAATRGWVQEGDDWVYLDSNGEREVNVWRRSGDNYYYLDEDGIMARDTLIEDDTVDAYYYVDENGVRITNAWKELPNDDAAQVGSENTDDTPEVLYYYFGSSGKAYTADNEKKVREIKGSYYMFNEEGQMLSGWQTSTDGDLYYFGTAMEGWAYTDWQLLEPNDYMNEEDYDELEYFYFGSSGKAKKDTTAYINGRYYHFNGDGIMDDDWYDYGVTTKPSAASGARAYASVNGNQASGWVYTGDADLTEEQRYDNDDMYWYYLVTIREGGNVARSIPYNYQAGGGVVRAKVIKNKTYLFDADGKMLDGFVVIESKLPRIPANVFDKDGNLVTEYFDLNDGGGLKSVTYNNSNDPTEKVLAWNYIRGTKNANDCIVVDNFVGADDPFAAVYEDAGDKTSRKTYAGIEGRTLLDGLYYFNEADGSVNGQMQTGRTAIEVDGDTYYYYFSKDSAYPGYAYTNTIQDGYLYGNDGKCVTAEDGNSYMVYYLEWDIRKGNDRKAIPSGEAVVVSRTGKVKTSGSVKIDGVKYYITDSRVTDTEIVD